MIDYKGMLNIKIDEPILLTGNVGVFVNHVTELFIKEFQVSSLLPNEPKLTNESPKKKS